MEPLYRALSASLLALGGSDGRIGVATSAAAPTDRQAFDRALGALDQVLGQRSRIVAARVQTAAELERELETPATDAERGRDYAGAAGEGRRQQILRSAHELPALQRL